MSLREGVLVIKKKPRKYSRCEREDRLTPKYYVIIIRVAVDEVGGDKAWHFKALTLLTHAVG